MTQRTQTYNIILSGGGTGGHIYPAIAIAKELENRFPTTTFLFVGAKNRMEMTKIPQAGFPIKGLWISGIQRKLSLKNLLFPFKLISSIWASYRIISVFKPDLVIGTGGFASGPPLFVAGLKKIPSLIQEQNSFPGLTNKLLAKKTDTICVAYDNLETYFPKHKIIKTGNPIRQDLLDIQKKTEEAISFFKLNPDLNTLLILGGSLGSKRINELIESKLEFFESQNIQLIWQCGSLYFETYKKYQSIKNVQVHAFLNRMDLAYAASHIIISRAGAITISELCVVGKPVIFIPSPNVAEDHQTKNATTIVEKGAAVMIKESQLEDKFNDTFIDLNTSKELRQTLSSQINRLAIVDATQKIVDEVEKLLEIAIK